MGGCVDSYKLQTWRGKIPKCGGHHLRVSPGITGRHRRPPRRPHPRLERYAQGWAQGSPGTGSWGLTSRAQCQLGIYFYIHNGFTRDLVLHKKFTITQSNQSQSLINHTVITQSNYNILKFIINSN